MTEGLQLDGLPSSQELPQLCTAPFCPRADITCGVAQQIHIYAAHLQQPRAGCLPEGGSRPLRGPAEGPGAEVSWLPIQAVPRMWGQSSAQGGTVSICLSVLDTERAGLRPVGLAATAPTSWEAKPRGDPRLWSLPALMALTTRGQHRAGRPRRDSPALKQVALGIHTVIVNHAQAPC